MLFDKYHFHLYFDKQQKPKSQNVIEKLNMLDDVEVGRVRESPVGPHPTGSCQITVQKGNFEKILSWFLVERDELDIFIHPLSGNDIKDHTDYAMWLGQQHKLNIDFFLS